MRIIIELDSASSQPEIKRVGGSDSDQAGTGFFGASTSTPVDAGYPQIPESNAPDSLFSVQSQQMETSMAAASSQAIDAGAARAPGSEFTDALLPQEIDDVDKANAISAGGFTGPQE